jgi:hypothetical protein
VGGTGEPGTQPPARHQALYLCHTPLSSGITDGDRPVHTYSALPSHDQFPVLS